MSERFIFGPFFYGMPLGYPLLVLIWFLDRYATASLKNGDQQQRGFGKSRQVAPETKLLRNGPDFLRIERIKKELFMLLANYSLHNFSQVHVVTNVDKELLSSDTQQTSL